MNSNARTGLHIRFLLCLVFCLACATMVAAQSTVTINGTVTDQSGAPVAGATVTATNVGTGLKSVAPTSAEGLYVIAGLPAALYDVQASQPGFATVVRHHQELLVGTTVTLDFTLRVSSVAQTVEVQAVAPDVDATSTQVSAVLHTQQLDDLPILSRNFSEMASLTPGVQSTSQVSVGFAVGGAVTGVTIGNSTQYETGYTVDDIPITKPSDGGLYVALAQDWVQEFSVVSNQVPAEYAGAVSGVVNAVTRSGTNEIHGRAYSFFQNSDLNASSFNAVRPVAKAPSSSQRVGGMLGGPIIKNKLFYFIGYEYFRSLAGVTFAGLPSTFAGSRDVMPVDLVPSSPSNLNRQDLGELKINYHMSPSDSFQVVGNIQRISEPSQASATNAFASLLNGNSTTNEDMQYSTEWVHIFSPTSINSLRFANATDWDAETCNFAQTVGPFTTTAPPLTSFGITPNGNPTGYYGELTYTLPNGTADVGCAGRFGGKHFVGLYAGIYDSVTKTKGRHEIQFGGQATDPFYGSNRLHSNSDGFYGFPTANVAATSDGILIPYAAGVPFNPSDPTTFPRTLTMNYGPFSHTYVMATGWSFGVFLQDSWRATDSFTLNWGIRWDGDLQYSYFNSRNACVSGTNNCLNPAVNNGNYVNNDFQTVSPRIGFAWTPFSKAKNTVLRGGFGVYYAPTTLTEATGYISQRTNADIIDGFTSNSPTANPYCAALGGCSAAATYEAYQNDLRALLAWSLANNTIPDLTLKSVNVGGSTYSLPGVNSFAPPLSNVYNIDPSMKKAAALQSTIGIAHSFNNGLSFTVDYAYVYGFDQDIEREVNYNPATLPAVTLLNPAYTTEYSTCSCGWFSDKQILSKLRYTDHRGDSAQVSYTLGWADSNSASTSDFNLHSIGAYNTDPFDFGVDKGPASTDQRQTLAVNGVVRLPGGFEFAPIITVGTGLPMTATTAQAPGAAPITVSNGNVITVPGCQPWYNQCYPAVNGVLTSKGFYRGATTVGVNARIQRPIKLRENMSITPMFEAYNIPNHVNFGTNYTLAATSPSFLKPSATTITMRQLQLGVRFDF
ncbi:MAG: TonB-dependent receptor [Candidatus Acidiferrales bacterium]